MNLGTNIAAAPPPARTITIRITIRAILPPLPFFSFEAFCSFGGLGAFCGFGCFGAFSFFLFFSYPHHSLAPADHSVPASADHSVPSLGVPAPADRLVPSLDVPALADCSLPLVCSGMMEFHLVPIPLTYRNSEPLFLLHLHQQRSLFQINFF